MLLLLNCVLFQPKYWCHAPGQQLWDSIFCGVTFLSFLHIIGWWTSLFPIALFSIEVLIISPLYQCMRLLPALSGYIWASQCRNQEYGVYVRHASCLPNNLSPIANASLTSFSLWCLSSISNNFVAQQFPFLMSIDDLVPIIKGLGWGVPNTWWKHVCYLIFIGNGDNNLQWLVHWLVHCVWWCSRSRPRMMCPFQPNPRTQIWICSLTTQSVFVMHLIFVVRPLSSFGILSQWSEIYCSKSRKYQWKLLDPFQAYISLLSSTLAVICLGDIQGIIIKFSCSWHVFVCHSNK